MIRLTKKDEDFSTLYWLTSIKGPSDDKRHHIMTVHIDTGVAVKTDGSRLHVACLNGDYPNGDYEIVKRTKSELILNPANPIHEYAKWPDWEMVFDSFPINAPTPNTYVNVYKNDMGKTITRFFINLYSKGLDAPAIDTFFIEAALAGFEGYNEVYFSYEDQPLFIMDDEKNRVAALMPFRV